MVGGLRLSRRGPLPFPSAPMRSQHAFPFHTRHDRSLPVRVTERLVARQGAPHCLEFRCCFSLWNVLHSVVGQGQRRSARKCPRPLCSPSTVQARSYWGQFRELFLLAITYNLMLLYAAVAFLQSIRVPFFSVPPTALAL